MTAVAGTVVSVSGSTNPSGPGFSADAAPQRVCCCDILVNFTGTYATADDGVVAAVTTAIQDARRNGRPVTLLGACPGMPGQEGSNIVGTMLCQTNVDNGAVDAATIKCALTDTTLAAEHGNGLLGAMNRPIGIRVTFKEL
jgi:hypothetical protein